MNRLFTIGFTQKTAERFFTLIKDNNINTIIDVRLNNKSQLAGFSKQNDFKYFLKELCNCDYFHAVTLAPTKNILDAFKKKTISWDKYLLEYNTLLKTRIVENQIPQKILNHSCLLCSEPSADNCHRRLAAEYLRTHYSELRIIHL